MEARDFCYWLNGYLEVSNASSLSERELQIIKDHLKLVFNKVTPLIPGTSGSIVFTTPCGDLSGGGGASNPASSPLYLGTGPGLPLTVTC